MYQLSAHRFFLLAEHIHTYAGAFQWRLRREQEEGQSPSSVPRSTSTRKPEPSSKPSTQKKHFQDAKHNPELAPYIEGLN